MDKYIASGASMDTGHLLAVMDSAQEELTLFYRARLSRKTSKMGKTLASQGPIGLIEVVH